jgi:transposase-like protein
VRWPAVSRKDVVHACPTPVEFRQRAVELARAGDKPVAVLAKELRVSESYLRSWMAPADADEGGRADRLTTAKRKELAELRRRNRQLEMENEILERVAAYLAGDNVLPK